MSGQLHELLEQVIAHLEDYDGDYENAEKLIGLADWIAEAAAFIQALASVSVPPQDTDG